MDRHVRLRAIAIFVLVALASGCAVSPPAAPRIERLPEGAGGPLAPARKGPLTPDEVVAMANRGEPANVIIQSLRDSRATYRLGDEEARDLARRGVPDEVIEYLRYGEVRPRARHVYPHPDYYDWPHWPGYHWPGYRLPGYYGYYGLGYRWHHRHPGPALHFGFGRYWW